MFAVAITLLVTEIRPPHVGEGESLLGKLVELWPSYLGYAIGFLVIDTVWANHHNRFRFIRRSDHVLLFLNILFLMCVAFLPFPTALLADHVTGAYAQRTTAVAVYSGTLTVTAIFFTVLWFYAASSRLVSRDPDPGLLRAVTRRYFIGMALYLVAFALAFFNVAANLALIVALALLFVLSEPKAQPKATTISRRR